MSRDFYIILPSSVKTHSSTNIIGRYKTTLQQRFHFPPNERWSAGLAEISYTKAWYNVRLRSHIKLFNEFGELFQLLPNKHVKKRDAIVDEDNTFDINDEQNLADLYIKPGYYESIQSLCQYINKKFENFSKVLNVTPLLKFDKISSRVTLKAGELDGRVYFPYLGDEVERILGLADEENKSLFWQTVGEPNIMLFDDNVNLIKENFKQKKYRGQRSAELNAGCHSLFIYSDIIEHNFVGDTVAQLLRIVEVPGNASYGETVVLRYDQPHYIPLQVTSFDTVEVEVKDDTDEIIPFETGRVIVKINLRKDD